MTASIGSRRAVLSPLYAQLKQAVLDRIRAGELLPGDRAPSERELAEQFSVSRMTARQALAELQHEGVIRRVQGTGSFVTELKFEQPLIEIVSFSEDMERRGLRPGALLLDLTIDLPSRMVASRLEIDLSTPVARIERLRLASGATMALETMHVPASLVPGIEREDLTGSVYRLLETRWGVVLDEASERLEAVSADAREAGLLEVPVGSALLSLERVTRDADGRPAELVSALYRGDRYVFTAHLRRPKPAAGASDGYPDATARE